MPRPPRSSRLGLGSSRLGLGIALSLSAVAGAPASAAGHKTAKAKAIGLIVLPGKGADAATAREVRQGILKAFRGDREVLLVDTARRVSAQPTTLDAATRRRLQEGIFALERGRARRAVSLLERVFREMRKNLAEVPKSALADAALHLAAAELARRRSRKALRTLVALLTWRKARRLNLRTTVPRGWEKLFDRAKAIVSMKRSGSLRISSVPSRAETYVDGKRTGPTPAVISNLLLGTHYVTVRLAGYKKSVLAVRVGSRERTIAVTLRERLEARELLTMLSDMRLEMGRETVLFPDALRKDLGLERTLVVVVDRERQRLSLLGYLYTLGDGKLRGTSTVKTDLPPRVEQLLPLAVWRASGSVPKRPRKVRAGKPFYKRWWFWAVLGVAGAAGVVIPLVATAGTDSGRSDRFRVTW